MLLVGKQSSSDIAVRIREACSKAYLSVSLS